MTQSSKPSVGETKLGLGLFLIGFGAGFAHYAFFGLLTIVAIWPLAAFLFLTGAWEIRAEHNPIWRTVAGLLLLLAGMLGSALVAMGISGGEWMFLVIYGLPSTMFFVCGLRLQGRFAVDKCACWAVIAMTVPTIGTVLGLKLELFGFLLPVHA